MASVSGTYGIGTFLNLCRKPQLLGGPSLFLNRSLMGKKPTASILHTVMNENTFILLLT